jgi:hypothetical protein
LIGQKLFLDLTEEQAATPDMERHGIASGRTVSCHIIETAVTRNRK